MTRVVGAGLGRTGTLSFKVALELIGFLPCYHIEDTVSRPGHLDAWEKVARGDDVDWRALFRDFGATADFPACLYFREQLAAFPDARVVLTVREPEAWARSVQALRAFNLSLRARADMQSKTMRRWGDTIDALVWSRLGDVNNLVGLMRFFADHTSAVTAHVAPDQLLVFDVRQGWSPLCRFLDVPIPDTAFPHVNERSALDDALATEDTVELRAKLRGGRGQDA